MPGKHKAVGDLRTRVTVARRAREAEGRNRAVETMTLLGHAWASFERVEEEVGGDDPSDGDHTEPAFSFTMRSEPLVGQIDARTVILHRGRRFKVRRILQEDQTGRFVSVLCTAGEMDPNEPLPRIVSAATTGDTEPDEPLDVLPPVAAS